MQTLLNPTKTPVLLLISRVDDNESFPEQIFKNGYWDRFEFITHSFQIQRFFNLPSEFWDLIDIANGIVVDDLSITEERQRGIYQHQNLNSFIKELLKKDEYNGCPIFASIGGFSKEAIVMQGIVFTWLIRTLQSNGFNFVVNEGDAVMVSSHEGRPFIRVNNYSFTNGDVEVEEFLSKMKKHHFEFWEPFRVSLKIYWG